MPLEKIRRAMEFKNITAEVFEQEYEGTLYVLRPNQTIVCNQDVAEYLAKYLAMKITKGEKMSKVDDKGVPVDGVIAKLYKEMITPTGVTAKTDSELTNKLLNPGATSEVTDKKEDDESDELDLDAVDKPVIEDEETTFPDPEDPLEKQINDEINGLLNVEQLTFNGTKYASEQSCRLGIQQFRKKRLAELKAANPSTTENPGDNKTEDNK